MLFKMRNGDILRNYVSSLLSMVEDKDHNLSDYSLLLEELYSIPFTCTIEMDLDRGRDAEILRNDICEENGLLFDVILSRKISVLEVLIALARRIENDILADPMSGNDNSNHYFWEMLENLGVEKYKNDNFKVLNVHEKVEKWLDRDFKKDGNGSIFPLKHPKHDQRAIEIWAQMQAYLMENY